MKNFYFMLVTFVLASFSLQAQEVPCGKSKTLATVVSSNVFCGTYAETSREAKSQVRTLKESLVQSPQKVNDLFKCKKGDECHPDYDCEKSSNLLNVWYTLETIDAGAKFRIKIRARFRATCEECYEEEEKRNLDVKPVSKLKAKCGESKIVNKRMKSIEFKADEQEDVQEKGRRVSSMLYDEYKKDKSKLNVSVECDDSDCEEDETCEGTYSIDDVEYRYIQQPLGSNCWKIWFIANIRVECSKCDEEDRKTELRNSTEYLDLNLSLFPNPTTEFLDVQSDSFDYGETYLIRLTNSSGTLIKEIGELLIDEDRIRLDVSDLPIGLYFFSLSSGANKYKVKSFVKID